MKGPTFIALHELFDQIQARVDAFTDDIAEACGVAGWLCRGHPAIGGEEHEPGAFPNNVISPPAGRHAGRGRSAGGVRQTRARGD